MKSKLKFCKVSGCPNRVHARGLCGMHYSRQWKTGEVFAGKPPMVRRELTGDKYGRWKVLGFSHSAHKATYWNCVCDCGTERAVRGSSLWTGKTSSCGCLISDMRKMETGENSRNWKGGRYLQYGYVMLKRPKHPNATSDGYVAEHRMVMSEHIGRPLERFEWVHHINGVRCDNRIENLRIVGPTTHYGTVVCPHCKVEFDIK